MWDKAHPAAAAVTRWTRGTDTEWLGCPATPGGGWCREMPDQGMGAERGPQQAGAVSDQTPWPDPRHQRPAPQPPPYAPGRQPVPPPHYGPPITAVPYATARRRVHPLVVVGFVLGGAALLCCGVGTVGALVDSGDPKGSSALPVAEVTTDAAEPEATPAPTTALAVPTGPAITTGPAVTTGPPASAKPKVTTRPPATKPAPRKTTPKPAKTTTKPARNCDPSYPTVCIPPAPPDLDCGQISHRNFKVLPPDPHRFDGSPKNGIGCET
jgi:hypothetical protein